MQVDMHNMYSLKNDLKLCVDLDIRDIPNSLQLYDHITK